MPILLVCSDWCEECELCKSSGWYDESQPCYYGLEDDDNGV